MKIDIIIPSHRNFDGLDRLLESISKIDTSSVSNILIVLNPQDPRAETTLTQKFRGRLPIQIFQSSITGVNHARNLGVKNASSELVLFLDDDEAIEDRTFLNQHSNAHKEDPDLCGFGGSYKLWTPTGFWSRAYHNIQMNWLAQGEALDGTNYNLCGGNVSLKRKVFEEFLFEENILFGGAETEFFFRLKKHKLKCRLETNLSILHFHNLSLKVFIRKAFLQGKSHCDYNFQDTRELRRKIKYDAHRESFDQSVARNIYSLAFNIGRRNMRIFLPRFHKSEGFFNRIRQKTFWLFLKIDFLTKKIEKPRSPDS